MPKNDENGFVVNDNRYYYKGSRIDQRVGERTQPIESDFDHFLELEAEVKKGEE